MLHERETAHEPTKRRQTILPQGLSLTDGNRPYAGRSSQEETHLLARRSRRRRLLYTDGKGEALGGLGTGQRGYGGTAGSRQLYWGRLRAGGWSGAHVFGNRTHGLLGAEDRSQRDDARGPR